MAVLRFRITYATHAELAFEVKQMAHGGVLVRDPAAANLAFDTPVVLELVMPDRTTLVSGGRVLQALAGLGVAVTIEPHVVEQAQKIVAAGSEPASTPPSTQPTATRILTPPTNPRMPTTPPTNESSARATTTPPPGARSPTAPPTSAGARPTITLPLGVRPPASTPPTNEPASTPTIARPTTTLPFSVRPPAEPTSARPTTSPPTNEPATTPAIARPTTTLPSSVRPPADPTSARPTTSPPTNEPAIGRPTTTLPFAVRPPATPTPPFGVQSPESTEPSVESPAVGRESADEPTRAQKIQLALHGTRDQRNAMLRDRDRGLHAFVLKNPGITVDDVLAIVKNPMMGAEIFKQISERSDWMQRPQIAAALARNPKVPGEIAIRALTYVAPDALRQIAKGTGAPPHVIQAARKRVLGK